MYNDTFREVLTHNGVVSITSWSDGNVHVANTWNAYLHLTEDDKLLIPAAWFRRTEKNVEHNDKVILTLGSPDVEGKMGMGTGFVVEGTAKFLTEGASFDLMKEKYSFLTRVLEVAATSVRQTI